MSKHDTEVNDVGPLSAKVLEYTRIIKDLVDRSKKPGAGRDDWASLSELVAIDQFRRVGIYREEMTWEGYLDFMVPWAASKDFDSIVRRITESGNLVFFEIEEHHTKDGEVAVVNSMNVFEFNEAERICRLDVYLQGQLGSAAFTRE